MNGRITCVGFLALVLLAGAAAAAPLEHDLGQGLRYVRVHELPGFVCLMVYFA